MDYGRPADESRNSIGSELQPIERDYGRSTFITSVHPPRMDESSARAPGAIPRVRSFGDPDHELVIFVVGRDLPFPCLADSRFPSRTRTCEIYALLRRTLVTIVSRTRAATLRLSASLRCVTTECHKFTVGFTEVKLSFDLETGMDRRSLKNPFLLDYTIIIWNLIDENIYLNQLREIILFLVKTNLSA